MVKDVPGMVEDSDNRDITSPSALDLGAVI
jgi:hypothetical protein